MLAFTFLLGCGAAFIGPAWQAIQPELVPRPQIPSAAALGAVNMNLARAVGPALGGTLVAAAGAGWVFGLNAASFVGVAAALASWRRVATPDPVGRERMVAALRSGARYVVNAPAMRRVLENPTAFWSTSPCARGTSTAASTASGRRWSNSELRMPCVSCSTGPPPCGTFSTRDSAASQGDPVALACLL